MSNADKPPSQVVLAPESVEAVAQRFAELMRAPAPKPLVLTRREAMAYVNRKSQGAFHAWCQRWKIKHVSHGRYARAALDLALEREGGIAHIPATLRAHQKTHDEQERARRAPTANPA